MPSELDNARLARLEEKQDTQRQLAIDHDKKDDGRFEKIFNFVKDNFDKLDNKLDVRFDKVDTRLDKMEDEIDILWDYKNKNEGALGLGKFVAGGIGGVLVAFIDYFSMKGH